MGEGLEVESGGCNCSNSHSCKECISKATLKGTFKRDDGVKFTASMTANGTADTACDAKVLSYTRIIKTLEKFIKDYTPKIVEGIYEITYSITCDGKPTCCKSLCNDSVLEFITYSVATGATATKSDFAVGTATASLAVLGNESIHKAGDLNNGNPIGDAIGNMFVKAAFLGQEPANDQAAELAEWTIDFNEKFRLNGAADDTNIDHAIAGKLTLPNGESQIVMVRPRTIFHGGIGVFEPVTYQRSESISSGIVKGVLYLSSPAVSGGLTLYHAVTLDAPIEVVSGRQFQESGSGLEWTENKYTGKWSPAQCWPGCGYYCPTIAPQ